MEALRDSAAARSPYPRSTMPKRKQGHQEEDEGDSESETVAGFLFIFEIVR